MAKVASAKRKALVGKSSTSFATNANSKIKDSSQVSATLLECMRTGNVDAFRDVLASHILNSNKLRLAKKTGLGRQTLYDILDPAKGFNPALSTVAAIFRGLNE
jgi:DNA-binding phage protein